jgi:hypothetical protein
MIVPPLLEMHGQFCRNLMGSIPVGRFLPFAYA